jgi:protein CpxP
MNRVKILTGAVIFLFLLNAGLIFFLMGPPPPHGGPGPKNEIIQLLELDKEQVVQYEEMIEAHQSNIQAQDAKIVELKQVLYQGLIDSQVDTDSIFTLLSKEKITVEKMHYSHFKALEGLCDENQKGNFKKLTKRLTELFSTKKKGRRKKG